MVFVVGVAVYKTIGGEQQGPLVAGLFLDTVGPLAVRPAHFYIDALGIVDRDVVSVEIAAFCPVVVEITSCRACEVSEMNRKQSFGGKRSCFAGFTQIEDAGFRKVENQVEFDIGCLLSGEYPVAVHH